MFGKLANPKQSQKVKQFELFIKRRNQKTSILQSQNQTIDTKVKCFEQLIRLNRKDTKTAVSPSVVQNLPKCLSFKNILACSGQSFGQLEQDIQLAFGNLNKMASGVNSENVSKQISRYQADDREELKSVNVKNRQEGRSKFYKQEHMFHSNSTNSSRIKTQSHNRQCKKGRYYLQADKRVNNIPLKKVNRNNLSKKFHYHQHSTPNVNSISIRAGQFGSLRKQIDDLTNKAKECYGISFEPQRQYEAVSFDFSPGTQKRQVSTAVSRIQMNRAKQNNYLKMVKEHTRQDSSIPMQFMGAIRSRGMTRPMSNQNSKRYIRI